MRGERYRNLRAAAAFLGCPTLILAAFSALRLAGQSGPEAAVAGAPTPHLLGTAETRPPLETGGEALMEAAAQAAARGDLAGADERYRLAWRDGATRAR